MWWIKHSMFLFLGALVLIYSAVDHDTVLLHVSESLAAKCLDGSSPAFYARKGYGSGIDKWLVYFEGDGWCYDAEQCYLRSKSDMGGSKGLHPHRIVPWFMNSDGTMNPPFYNWNTIHVPYCDGSSFSGNAEFSFQKEIIHINGKLNRDAIIHSLLELDISKIVSNSSFPFSNPPSPPPLDDTTPHTLADASEVIVAGSGSGALAVLLGIDDIADTIRLYSLKRSHTTASAGGGVVAATGAVHIRGLVDSGFYMDYTSEFPVEITHHHIPSYDEAITPNTIKLNGNKNMDFAKTMRELFSFMNISAGTNQACLRAHSKQQQGQNQPETRGHTPHSELFSPQSDCIFPVHLVPHIKTPLFFLQSQFDSWQILHEYSQNLSPSGVNQYGADLVDALKLALFTRSSSPTNEVASPFATSAARHGAFVDSCTHHGMQGCFGGGRHENHWAGLHIRSNIHVNITQLTSLGLSDPAGAHTNWNIADAFMRWYRHSLKVETTNYDPHRQGAEEDLTKDYVGIVPGLNWFFQEASFPCKGCCTCSPKIAGQFAGSAAQRPVIPIL